MRELAVWDAGDPEGFCTNLSHCFRNLIRNEVRRNCNHNVREISFDASAGERSPAEIELDGVVCNAGADCKGADGDIDPQAA